jgi:hypothetical protein
VLANAVEVINSVSKVVAQGVNETGAETAEAVGVGFVAGALMTAPLFQIIFFPALMQVNFFPDEIVVNPGFLQEDPALTAAKAGIGAADPRMASETKRAKDFFILKMVPNGPSFVFSLLHSQLVSSYLPDSSLDNASK